MHGSTPTRPTHARGTSTGYFPPMPTASGSGAASSSSVPGSPRGGMSAAAGATPAGPPVTRSRTLFFLSIRDTTGGGGGAGKRYRRKQDGYGEVGSIGEDEREGLIPGEGRGGSVALDMDGQGGAVGGQGAGLPPKWCVSRRRGLQVRRASPLMDCTQGRHYRRDCRHHGARADQECVCAPAVLHADRPLIPRPHRITVSALEKLHAKHVLPGFNDRSREEREIEAQTADITRVGLAWRVPAERHKLTLSTQDLRRMHKLLTAIRPASAQRNEQITAQNVQRGLAAKVQDLSDEFRKKQRVYMGSACGCRLGLGRRGLIPAYGVCRAPGARGQEQGPARLERGGHAQRQGTARRARGGSSGSASTACDSRPLVPARWPADLVPADSPTSRSLQHRPTALPSKPASTRPSSSATTS